MPRRRRLKELREEQRTLVFYEAPHRIAALLGDLEGVFGGERHFSATHGYRPSTLPPLSARGAQIGWLAAGVSGIRNDATHSNVKSDAEARTCRC